MQIGKKEIVDFTSIPLIILQAFDASHSIRQTSFSSACNALLLLRFRNRIGRLTGQVVLHFWRERVQSSSWYAIRFSSCVFACERENEKETAKIWEILNYELIGFFCRYVADFEMFLLCDRFWNLTAENYDILFFFPFLIFYGTRVPKVIIQN